MTFVMGFCWFNKNLTPVEVMRCRSFFLEKNMRIYGKLKKSLMCDEKRITYIASVSCKYNYQAGCMYLRNGDPGYPDEESYEDMEIDSIDDIDTFDDEDGFYVIDNYDKLEHLCLEDAKKYSTSDAEWNIEW